jgi:hypothetical protein
MDPIDRQAIHDKVTARYPDSDTTQYNIGYADAINDVLKDIRYMPSAEPKTAKRIVACSRSGLTMWLECGMCHEPVDEKDTFCRRCGRRFGDE